MAEISVQILKSRIFLQLAVTVVFIFLLPLSGLSQDELKVRSIDSVVFQINNSNLRETTDTLNNDMPVYNIFMSTLRTTIADGANLKKYVHHVLNFDNSQKKLKTGDYTSIFYYDQNTLVKVEESADDKNGIFKVFWYFENNKLIKFQMQPMPADNGYYEKIKEREQVLQGLSKSFLVAFHLKHPST